MLPAVTVDAVATEESPRKRAVSDLLGLHWRDSRNEGHLVGDNESGHVLLPYASLMRFMQDFQCGSCGETYCSTKMQRHMMGIATALKYSCNCKKTFHLPAATLC